MTNEQITQSLMETLARIRVERDDLKEELERRKSCYFCSFKSFCRSIRTKLQLE